VGTQKRESRKKIEREMMTDFSNSKAMMDVIRKRKAGKVF